MKIKSLFMAMLVAGAMFVAIPVQASDGVNVNTASVEQLQSVKGIGPKKAAAIVAYREAHGDFKSVGSLTDVKGIGKKILKKIENDLTLGGDDNNHEKKDKHHD